MDRYFNANVATSAPTRPVGAVKGYPQDSDMATNKLPTIPGAYAFWQIFAEMLNLVAAGGETPDPDNLTQVATAVENLANAAALAAQNAAIAAAAADATAKANGAITTAASDATAKSNTARSGAVSDVNAEFTGSNQQLTASGFQRLPGGLILQWTTAVVNGPSNTSVTWPMAFPSAILGVLGTSYGSTMYGSAIMIISQSVSGCVVDCASSSDTPPVLLFAIGK